MGLKHTGETPHSQCPHRSLISLGNCTKIIIKQRMLPREAAPVGSDQAGCWLEALGLCYQEADPPYTHTHRAQGPAWGESHTGHHNRAVTRLSRCTGRARVSSPPAQRCREDRASTGSSFLMRGGNKRKKQLYFHLKLSQKKRKVLWSSLGLFLWWKNAFHLSKMHWFIG